MKFTCLLGCLLFFVLGSSWTRAAESFPFQVGERLTYQIYWGPLVAGKAILEVMSIETVDGHDCYRLKATAKTTGLADLLFRVESISESWLDVKDLRSRRYRQDRAEGKHVRKDLTTFDYEKGEFTITNLVSNTTQRFPLTKPVVDAVSSLYVVRAQDLALHSRHEFTLNASRTNYLVNLSPDQRRTMWIRPLGDVAALRIEPKPTLRIVAANKGRMWLWISDDERRLPLLLTSQMSIGTAKLVLDKVETPRQTDAAARPSPNQPRRPFDFSSQR